MSQLLYEFEGSRFDDEQSARFTASVGRDYYSADCQVRPQRESFRIENARSWSGYVPISAHRSVGAKTVVRRSTRQVRNSTADIYLIWIPVRGSVTLTQNGRTSTVERGSIALSSSSDALCVLTNTDPNQEHLSYQVTAPAQIIKSALSDPKQFCAIPFSSETGGSRIARQLFLALYEESQQMDRASSEALVLSGIDTLLRAVGQERGDQPQPLGVREVKLQKLLDYLDLNLSDSELTTEKAAKACQISTRYLHYLLKGSGVGFHDYVWTARLDSARRQLTDGALSRRSIAEIAYSSGFKSSAHFSRAFRRHFSQSPREVRQSCRSA
jgi:AraC-like DNA-binding protein